MEATAMGLAPRARTKFHHFLAEPPVVANIFHYDDADRYRAAPFRGADKAVRVCPASLARSANIVLIGPQVFIQRAADKYFPSESPSAGQSRLSVAVGLQDLIGDALSQYRAVRGYCKTRCP